MRCEEVRNQLADRLIGTLGPHEEREIREHLIGCAECRAEASELGVVWENLAAIPAESPDSEAMRSRFYAELEKHEARRTDPQPSLDWWGRWSGALQAVAALALVSLGFVAGRYVQKSSQATSEEMASLRREVQDVRQVAMLSLMQQQSATERLRGVTWSEQIDRPGDEVVGALLDTLMHDPNINVRLATIDALARVGDSPRVRRGVVEALNVANSPLVQIALIDFVVDQREKDSVPTLPRLATDPQLDQAVRERASSGLRRLG